MSPADQLLDKIAAAIWSETGEQQDWEGRAPTWDEVRARSALEYERHETLVIAVAVAAVVVEALAPGRTAELIDPEWLEKLNAMAERINQQAFANAAEHIHAGADDEVLPDQDGTTR